jgi:hypothetical protein
MTRPVIRMSFSESGPSSDILRGQSLLFRLYRWYIGTQVSTPSAGARMRKTKKSSHLARSVETALIGALVGACAAVLFVKFLPGGQAAGLTPIRLFLIVAVGISCGAFISLGGVQYSVRYSIHYVQSQVQTVKEYGFVQYLRGVSRIRILQFAWWLILGQILGWLVLSVVASTPLVFLVPSQRELPFILAVFPMFGGLLGVALYWLVRRRKVPDDNEKVPMTARRVLNVGLRIPLAVLIGYLMGMLNLLGVGMVEGFPLSMWSDRDYFAIFGGMGSLAGFIAGIKWAVAGFVSPGSLRSTSDKR